MTLSIMEMTIKRWFSEPFFIQRDCLMYGNELISDPSLLLIQFMRKSEYSANSIQLKFINEVVRRKSLNRKLDVERVALDGFKYNIPYYFPFPLKMKFFK